MFVAVEGDKLVGTLALIPYTGVLWHNKGQYGYLCLGAVLPEFSGQGINRSLYQTVEKNAKKMESKVLTRDTNEKNGRMLKITKQEGYYYVGYKVQKDHCSIIRAKWLDGCPYSILYIKTRFLHSKIRGRIQKKMGLV